MGTLVATDPDTDRHDLRYETSDGRFMIERMGSGTGVYYVLKATTSLNYESVEVVDGTTTVVITVIDGANNSMVENLVVTVSDRNDEAPENLRIEGQKSVKEGEVGVVGTLRADDRDTDGGDLIFSVGGGSDFTVEKIGSGVTAYYELKSKASLNYEDVGFGF